MDKQDKNIYAAYMESANPLPWRELPEETRIKAEGLIKQHNDAVNNPNLKTGDFYAIDVTGKHIRPDRARKKDTPHTKCATMMATGSILINFQLKTWAKR